VGAEANGSGRLERVDRTPAQDRVIGVAYVLFGEHGVSGTSLQMIADALGVTKAAVYHQFKTKDEIVIANAQDELVELQDALDAAEAEPDRARGLDLLLTEIVDRYVERRRRTVLLQNDPVVVRLFAHHEPFRRFMDRLYGFLIGADPEHSTVQAAMMASAIGAAVVHPLVVDLDDDELRNQLLHFARRLVQVPSTADLAPAGVA
jgi:AcrR family transcriptional regulator